ncbi:MAG: L-threonine 3-dehydrogenase [Acidimicrobiales bacterium]
MGDATMSALRKARPEPGLDLDTMAARPSIGPRDVLVAVRYAGICGTDHHIYDWDEWSANRVRLGIVVGHEFTGTVAAVGDSVSRVSVGQRVSGEGHIGCGVCELCRTGRAHICEHIDIIGIDRDGCFAEFVAMPDRNIWALDRRIPDHAAAIMDPLGNAMHAVTAARVSGRSVLVTGAGVIGLASIAIARSLGADRILATDVDPHRLDLARHFGADVVVLATDPGWVAEVRGATAGEGPDVLIEMSGHPAALRGGFTALRNGGTAALLGLPASAVALDIPGDIIFKGATVLGINGRLVFDTWYEVERILLSGRLDLDALITDVLPLEKFDEAFALIASRAALKVIFEIGAP